MSTNKTTCKLLGGLWSGGWVENIHLAAWTLCCCFCAFLCTMCPNMITVEASYVLPVFVQPGRHMVVVLVGGGGGLFHKKKTSASRPSRHTTSHLDGSEQALSKQCPGPSPVPSVPLNERKQMSRVVVNVMIARRLQEAHRNLLCRDGVRSMGNMVTHARSSENSVRGKGFVKHPSMLWCVFKSIAKLAACANYFGGNI